MIVGAAVCPGAPFLIRGTADGIASRLQPVTDACAAAVSRLPTADAVLLITASREVPLAGGTAAIAWRELSPGTAISSSALRRSDLPESRPVALTSDAGVTAGASPGGGVRDPTVVTPSVGTMVGAALLADRAPWIAADPGNAAGRPTTPTTAIEIIGDPVAVAAMLADRFAGDERIAVLVIADGAACHGDHAPGRRDDRATTFEAALAAALAAGDPDSLRAACADRQLARDLLAGVEPLTVLALLATEHPPAVPELLFSGAPMGVGYLVASWRWSGG